MSEYFRYEPQAAPEYWIADNTNKPHLAAAALRLPEYMAGPLERELLGAVADVAITGAAKQIDAHAVAEAFMNQYHGSPVRRLPRFPLPERPEQH